ncbi:RHS domain-containing protein [Streptomyces sp. NPDC005706]|uniref:RHS domain-containing protein n=1 Tax=Streptomyces sp. NPDC005706 TaxID=3157169 RepID=UPI0033E29A95
MRRRRGRTTARATARATPIRSVASPASRTPQQEIDSRFFAIVTDLVGTPSELIDEQGDIAWPAPSNRACRRSRRAGRGQGYRRQDWHEPIAGTG